MSTEKEKKYRRDWYYRNRDKIVKDPAKPIQFYDRVGLEILCDGCGKSFKPRQKSKIRQNHKNFCTRDCYHIHLRNDLTPFRTLRSKTIGSSKRGTRILDHSVTAEYLKSLWEKQKGLCAYSGVPMILPITRRIFMQSPCSVSVDRICSDQGYVPENVELVCRFVNMGKNQFSKESIQQFFKQVTLVAD